MRGQPHSATYPDCTAMRRAARPAGTLVLCIGLALGQTACSSGPDDLPPPPFIAEEVRADFGTIAVVPAPPMTSDEIKVPPGKGEAAIDGMFIGMMEAGAVGANGGSVGALIGLLLMPIGAVAGGIGGARDGVPADQIEQASAAIEAALLDARAEPSISARVFRYARAELSESVIHRPAIATTNEDATETSLTAASLSAAMPGVDTMIEISDGVVLLYPAGGWEADPTLWFRLDTRVRVLRAADGSELFNFVRGWGAGEWHKFTEWAQDDARLLRQAIELTRRMLAQKITEHLLLVFQDPRARVPESGQGRLGIERRANFPNLPPKTRLVWGFTPDYPPVEPTPFEIDSLQPTFVWRPFPGYVDIPGPDGASPETVPFVPVDLDRVGNVTYEIQIRNQYDPDTERRGMVYQRRGIVEPRHRIEEPLEPGLTYQWALRAWFELDGKTRVSEWSQSLRRSEDETVTTAGWRGFFFDTPGS